MYLITWESMDVLAEFSNPPHMPPTETIRDTDISYFSGVGVSGGVGEANYHQDKDWAITRFLSRFDHSWGCLWRISTTDNFCVKTLAVSVEGIPFSHCRMHMYGIWKLDPPPLAEAFFISGRVDRIL